MSWIAIFEKVDKEKRPWAYHSARHFNIYNEFDKTKR